MTLDAQKKLSCIILSDPDPTTRIDLGQSLVRLANVVERYSEGESALAYLEQRPAEMAIFSLSSWHTLDDAIERVSVLKKYKETTCIVTHRKITPRQLYHLQAIKGIHVFGQPLDPLYLFRMAHDKYGIFARQFDRLSITRDVFWGTKTQREVIGTTLDISRGGMMLLSERKLSRGSSLFLGLQLDEYTSIEARCEIIKLDEHSYAPQWAYGIAFVDLPTTTGMLLEEAVAFYKDDGAQEAPLTFTEE